MNRTESDLLRTPDTAAGDPADDRLRTTHFTEFDRVPRLTASIIKPVRGLSNDYEKRFPPHTT